MTWCQQTPGEKRTVYRTHAPVIDGPRLRLVGERLPEDEAALGVGLGGVLAGRLQLPAPCLLSPFTPPSFAGGGGGPMVKNSNLATAPETEIYIGGKI